MMPPLLLVVTFIISWSIMLFFVLPLGVVTPEEHDPLHAPGAPMMAQMPRKFLLSAVLALVATGVIAWLSTQSWMSFR